MAGKYQDKSKHVRNGGIGRLTGRMEADAGLVHYREVLCESRANAQRSAFTDEVFVKRLSYARWARAIGVVTALVLMLAILVVIGAAQCTEQGPIRFSSGQAGGDLAAYLISLYCVDGFENASRLTVLTEWDDSSVKSRKEENSSIVASEEGTLTMIEGGGASRQDEQEPIAEYTGEMDIHRSVQLAP